MVIEGGGQRQSQVVRGAAVAVPIVNPSALLIEQLLMRYAAALNTRDADTYVSLFTPDA